MPPVQSSGREGGGQHMILAAPRQQRNKSANITFNCVDDGQCHGQEVPIKSGVLSSKTKEAVTSSLRLQLEFQGQIKMLLEQCGLGNNASMSSPEKGILNNVKQISTDNSVLSSELFHMI